VVFLCNKTK